MTKFKEFHFNTLPFLNFRENCISRSHTMSLLQNTLFSQESTILVHPLASLGALAHYTKQQDSKTIGLLLSTKSNEVINSIPLKSVLRDEGYYWVDETHLQKQWDILNSKVIGWYLVNDQSELDGNEVELHHFFENEFATNLIFVLFDVTPSQASTTANVTNAGKKGSSIPSPVVKMRAYKKTNLSFGKKVLAEKFEIVDVKHEASSQERVALRSILGRNTGYTDSLKEMKNNLKLILDYLNNSNKDRSNLDLVCQEVQEALDELPSVQKFAFKTVFETCEKDIRMANQLIEVVRNEYYSKNQSTGYNQHYQSHHRDYNQHYNREYHQNRDQRDRRDLKDQKGQRKDQRERREKKDFSESQEQIETAEQKEISTPTPTA